MVPHDKRMGEIAMLKKQIAKWAIAACAAMALVGVAIADGNVFWWKGADWGQFNNPANWDVGAEGEGNPDNLIPGADDAVAHSAVAKIDLGGNTYTINRRAKNFTSAVDATTLNGINVYIDKVLHLTNGTLKVTQHHGAKLNIEVWNGATYDFAGTSYRDAYNIYSEAVEKIHSGGRIAVGSNSTFYLFGLKFTIDEGGTFLFNPKTFTSHPTTGKVLSFSNYGTFEAPKGIYLVSPGWGTAANTAPQFTQYGGVTKLGGNVGRANSTSVKQLGFTLAGGKLEVTNSVAFVNMSANPPNIDGNASIEIEVKPESLLDMTGMVFGEDVAITKTGAGDLKMKDTYPASLAVSAGRLIAAEAVSLAGVSFAAGTQFRTDVEYVRIDDCASFSNVTFRVDESLLQIGSTVLLSSDPTILAHAKEGLDAQLQAAGIQAEGRIANGALVVRSAYLYTFNANQSSDLTDPTAWRSGSVPSAETPVRISGVGTVNFTAESTKFASITVEEGATLSVSGGTEESPVDMPPVELDYEARLLLAEGSVVQITNTFTCVGNVDILPVFEVATNAKAIVQTPEPLYIRSSYDQHSYDGNDYGFRIKNVSLKWYGDIQTHYGDTKDATTIYSRLLLGWAEAGETSYIAIDCRGGRYIAAGEANSPSRTRTPLVLAVPQPGGTVVPVGTLYFRDYACVFRTSTANNPEIHTSGLCIGRWNAYNGNTAVAGNPASVAFDVLFEGTVDLLMSGFCRIGGGAHVTLRGPGVQWRYVRTAYNDETLPRQLIMNDSGTLAVEDGAYLDICSSDSSRGFSASGTQDGQNVLTVRDSRLSLLNWSGSEKNVAEVDESLLEIGYLRSADTLANITGVFTGLRSVAISNTFTIAAADVDRGNPSKTTATSVENWHRRVHIAPPLTGTGSLAVSNELSGAHAVYSMTVTVTNGANTATGRAFVNDTAGGAPAALVFADGANWAGEVVSNGRVSLTNLASEAESAASVSFGTLRLDANFPVRLWKIEGELTNDVINIAGGVSGGCGLVPKLMGGYAPEIGDTFTLGTYPAEAALPKAAGGSSWRIYTVEQEGVTYLMLRCQPRGLCFSFK